MNEQKHDTASFGYREVQAEEKPKLVRQVFSSVARRYDIMNDLMSGGIHRVWKDIFVSWLDPRPGWTVLDVAGGTGDIAFRIARHAEKRAKQQAEVSGGAEIIVCDINADMLGEGRKRPDAEALPGLSWVCGDAERLPVPDATADAYTIAFGIRNCTHIDRVLAEAYRVLKPGGRFLCLEFSHVDVPMLDRLYDFYSFAILPRMGELVAGDGAAYRYLAESIRRFPQQAEFARMIGQAGFAQVSVRNLTGGIAAMHSGWKV
jgi:demethylmenaquinone methyltransferase/2-methoxy-6-polyprenyl-1,4-benzoquinol methylase